MWFLAWIRRFRTVIAQLWLFPEILDYMLCTPTVSYGYNKSFPRRGGSNKNRVSGWATTATAYPITLPPLLAAQRSPYLLLTLTENWSLSGLGTSSVYPGPCQWFLASGFSPSLFRRIQGSIYHLSARWKSQSLGDVIWETTQDHLSLCSSEMRKVFERQRGRHRETARQRGSLRGSTSPSRWPVRLWLCQSVPWSSLCPWRPGGCGNTDRRLAEHKPQRKVITMSSPIRAPVSCFPGPSELVSLMLSGNHFEDTFFFDTFLISLIHLRIP